MSAQKLPTSFWIFDFIFKVLPHLILFSLIIGLWEMAVSSGMITSIIIPRPSRIGSAIVKLYITEGTIYRHFFITLTESVVGFLIGGQRSYKLGRLFVAIGKFQTVCHPLCDSIERDTRHRAYSRHHSLVRVWDGIEDRSGCDYLVFSYLREYAHRTCSGGRGP